MFTTHTYRVLPICLMLVLILVVSAPALAMNDPATGRWMTRDPLFYNRKSLSPSPPYHRRPIEHLRHDSVDLSSHPNSATTAGFRAHILDMAHTLKLAGKHSHASRLLFSVQQVIAVRQEDINLYQLSISNPFVFLDPFGTCVSAWGNYCGPKFCGGKPICPCTTPGAVTWCDYSVPPIDDVDSACKDHDQCYDDTGASYPDPLCDSILCDQLLAAGQPPGMGNLTWGGLILAFCGFWP